MDKSELRRSYFNRRQELTTAQIEDNSIAIANRVLELPIWEATYFHIFLSIQEKKEVNTEFLLHILQGRDKSIVVPKAFFKTGELNHILLQEHTKITLSQYGIPEPVEGIEVPVIKLEVIFIPLLAFDNDGNRLGYGKGFYDRFLSQCHPNTIKIGLSFFEPEPIIPHNDKDIPLDYCITPKNTHSFS